MPYMKINHEVDPKEKLLADLGDISGLEISNNNVLVAVYQRPTTTMLGGKTFYVSDKVVDEDRYQSKVGLIIGQGPTAFDDPEGQWFTGIEFKLHDWIVTPASSAYSMMVNGVMCRLVPDTSIKMRVNDPDVIY
jgi:hypothetical protein